MNLLLDILLGAGAVIGALGMLLLVAGGVATAAMDADSGEARVIETTGRPVGGRQPAPAAARTAPNPVAA